MSSDSLSSRDEKLKGLVMEKEISEERVDFIVGNIVANLSFEGMITPQEEIEELKEVVRGNISREEYKKKVLEECKEYRQKRAEY